MPVEEGEEHLRTPSPTRQPLEEGEENLHLEPKQLGTSAARNVRSLEEYISPSNIKQKISPLGGNCAQAKIVVSVVIAFSVSSEKFSSKLRKVMKIFSRWEIVGKRFPICHVHIEDEIVEVSSFSTSAKNRRMEFSLGFDRPVGCEWNRVLALSGFPILSSLNGIGAVCVIILFSIWDACKYCKSWPIDVIQKGKYKK